MEPDVPSRPEGNSAISGPHEHAPVRTNSENVDLAASLTALSRLSLDWNKIEDLLVTIAGFAVQAIPRAEGAGLTMTETGRPDVIVKTADFVREIDAIQYGIKEGPCISAAASGTSMRSGSLGGDPRWPRFGPRAGRLGVHSVLSLPLQTSSGVVGAMNIYAHTKDAFDEGAEEAGQTFAVPAAIAVHNALILDQTNRLARNLQAALASRPIIDQAIGILRSRSGGTTEEAFGRLRSMSQADHVKLTTVAATIVDQAVYRARARHTGSA